MPGMGGVDDSRNFILNCADWEKIYHAALRDGSAHKIDRIQVEPAHIGIAPVTGAVQNVGFQNEHDFYLPYFTAAHNCGILVCTGDGAPDDKLALSIEAVRSLGTKAYCFLKPYPDDNLLRRVALVKDHALAIGMDIDAYNIVSMRDQVRLERKTAEQIAWLRGVSNLPLMLKGIFTPDDIALCRAVRPDIAVVSNHGGRVDTSIGSTAEFLKAAAGELHSCCGEVWVDGGIRTKRDIQTALYLGADRVLIGRPFITAVCRGVGTMESAIRSLLG